MFHGCGEHSRGPDRTSRFSHKQIGPMRSPFVGYFEMLVQEISQCYMFSGGYRNYKDQVTARLSERRLKPITTK